MKDKILTILKCNKGHYVSGQSISEGLGVSRAAIWKSISRLKEEGYVIDALSKNGYMFVASPDLLSYEELKEYLNTRLIGRQILHLESTESTNTRAKELASSGSMEGTVVISEEQTSGRGRFGRLWCSPKGKGIWMSIILRPDIDPMNAAGITLIGSAAVFKAMKDMGVQTKIKWPNDIILNGKKLCGILTEMSGELNRINYLVMGIGVNVNITSEEFPGELRNIAASIKAETGGEVSRQRLAALILNHFEELYDKFIKENDMKSTIDICRENSILIGREIQIFNRDILITVKAVDIDAQGLLVVEHKDGSIERIISGEVTMNGLNSYKE